MRKLRVHPYARQVLVEYDRHLRDERGLAASTIHFRLQNAAAMLTTFSVRSRHDFRVVTASQVTGFIASRTAQPIASRRGGHNLGDAVVPATSC